MGAMLWIAISQQSIAPMRRSYRWLVQAFSGPDGAWVSS